MGRGPLLALMLMQRGPVNLDPRSKFGLINLARMTRRTKKKAMSRLGLRGFFFHALLPRTGKWDGKG